MQIFLCFFQIKRKFSLDLSCLLNNIGCEFEKKQPTHNTVLGKYKFRRFMCRLWFLIALLLCLCVHERRKCARQLATIKVRNLNYF